MKWILVYLQHGAGRELIALHDSRDAALRDAEIKRQRHAVFRIEGPAGETLDGTEIAAELAAGKYAPLGMALPKRLPE